METDLRPPTTPSILWLNGSKVEPTPVTPGSSSDVPRALPIQLKAGPNPCLLKLRVEGWDWVFSMQALPSERASVELLVTDAEGRPVSGAVIQLFDQGEAAWSLRTGTNGQAEACLYPLANAYDVRATSGETGAWLYDVALRPGERRRLTLRLSMAGSLSGRVLAMDHSPQNAIVVQALRDPERSGDGPSPVPAVQTNGDEPSPRQSAPKIRSFLPLPPFSETVLSDTNGNFRFVNLRPGAYRLRRHGSDGFIYPTNNAERIVAMGRTNEPVEFVFANAKRGVWRNYSITKGLAELNPLSVHRTPDGLLWVGTEGGTLHSYDGVEFKMFQAPQTPGAYLESINHDSAGTVWIGAGSGISRSIGAQFQPLPFGNRFPRANIRTILTDPDGGIWFGTGSGLGHYAGGRLSAWTVAEALPCNAVASLLRDRDGALWMGTTIGVVKFESGKFTVPLAFPGSSPMEIRSLHQARDGVVWFCSPTPGRDGVYRFDTSGLQRLGVEHGMPSDSVFDIAETSDGDLWFATRSGLSRFNGTTLLNYTDHDGLSNGWVRDIFVDEDDVLWLAKGWGVSRFDPNTFTGVTQRDGIQNHVGSPVGVFSLEGDEEDGFWVGTEWGGAIASTAVDASQT